jgi:CobW/HypB/UreG, nucleotide-binding domain
MIHARGSAFPATLAFQIRQLERDTGDFILDAIVTVIDAENFVGYEDTSPTAKMQASYSDIILIVGLHPFLFINSLIIHFRINGNIFPTVLWTLSWTTCIPSTM